MYLQFSQKIEVGGIRTFHNLGKLSKRETHIKSYTTMGPIHFFEIPIDITIEIIYIARLF